MTQIILFTLLAWVIGFITGSVLTKLEIISWEAVKHPIGYFRWKNQKSKNPNKSKKHN